MKAVEIGGMQKFDPSGDVEYFPKNAKSQRNEQT